MGIVIKAPAKINLYLGVHKQTDARGYHRVDSLMVALDLADEVQVQEADSLSVTCVPEVDFPQEKNTAYVAARLLGEAYGRKPNVAITINKHIPEQSGMGGSSSDAAAVLKALCRLWGVDERNPSVAATARAVGADVPFFLDPVPTLFEGAGDIPREEFPSLGEVPVVLVRPKGSGVSTRRAYQTFDSIGNEANDCELLCDAMRKRDVAKVAANLSNNLDDAACVLKPEIKEIKKWLKDQREVLGCQVTGSGSCVYGICQTWEGAQTLATTAGRNPNWWVYATRLQ